ncbi:bifunctional DNA-binding transcriptional regulator/O6-methylguanine-DNA methyltransferase Ada [Gimibacter soli]|uniref:Regulatory protein of adaptive response n=2 Tax=Gimibacter soli TaxID=3024400 RepID=A0AAF0BLZ8_9PROT|nr:bifunctional DNA-binding transcriptional regulator/O6-methylguanine-DNA methyltransferase Ada [Gimibacter soli]WCL53806.1 bifunctional DNA-binding transcriptional regulator/O6-methylguanine-DNA methyltransferase Ada [Gimibacter soli]
MKHMANLKGSPLVPAADYETDDARWRALLARDARADGRFYFSVATTGVYCRPSCAARQPRRENVAFHTTMAEAEAAGFRACKRCKPDETPAWHAREKMVARACRFIEDAETPPTLDMIAADAGLSPYHFHRLFKQVTGVTPKAYAASHRAKSVKGSLKGSRTVTEALYDAGFNASSRFYEGAKDMLGMTPGEYRGGAVGKTIRYTILPCTLGLMLVGATDVGVCTIQFGDDEQALQAALVAEFPEARFEGATERFGDWVKAALAFVETGEGAAKLPLDIAGTAFQRRVWAALQAIPAGETVSYKQVAEAIGEPAAVRAVARACASNRIAVAIPCHRVVRADGGLSGYRWGVARKRTLLDREGGQ